MKCSVCCAWLSSLALAGCIAREVGGEQARAPAGDPALATPAAAPGVSAPCASAALIDDLEDGDVQVSDQDGRKGVWFISIDKVGTVNEPAGGIMVAKDGAEGSKHSAMIKGKLAAGGNHWAAMALSFNEPRAAVDASHYKGISFWARKGGAGASSVRVKFPDAGTDPLGGSCKDCYNDFGANIELTGEWKQYTIRFADLKQETGWGDRVEKFSVDKLYGLQWGITSGGPDYELWVDQIQFSCE